MSGTDLHVLDLAAAQRAHGRWQPLVLAPTASDDYRERLAEANVDVVAPGRRILAWHRLPETAALGLVHAHGYEANYLMVGLRRVSRQWSRLPLVVTGHGWVETSPWLRLKSQLDRWSARAADVRIACAAVHAPRFRPRQRTLVVHNGVRAPDRELLARLRSRGDAVRTELGIPSGRFVVGVVGRLSAEKRVDLVLAAAARTAAEHPEVHVLVVGGGPGRHRLEGWAEHLGIDDRVTFTGLLREVTPAYAAMDLVVQASDTEGSPRTILESMAAGLPVIATDVGDVGVLLDGGAAGTLVPAGDADALARAIAWAIEEPDDLRRRADRAGLRQRTHFTIEVMRQRIDEAYALAVRNARDRRSPR